MEWGGKRRGRGACGVRGWSRGDGGSTAVRSRRGNIGGGGGAGEGRMGRGGRVDRGGNSVTRGGGRWRWTMGGGSSEGRR